MKICYPVNLERPCPCTGWHATLDCVRWRPFPQVKLRTIAHFSSIVHPGDKLDNPKPQYWGCWFRDDVDWTWRPCLLTLEAEWGCWAMGNVLLSVRGTLSSCQRRLHHSDEDSVRRLLAVLLFDEGTLLGNVQSHQGAADPEPGPWPAWSVYFRQFFLYLVVVCVGISTESWSSCASGVRRQIIHFCNQRACGWLVGLEARKTLWEVGGPKMHIHLLKFFAVSQLADLLFSPWLLPAGILIFHSNSPMTVMMLFAQGWLSKSPCGKHQSLKFVITVHFLIHSGITENC